MQQTVQPLMDEKGQTQQLTGAQAERMKHKQEQLRIKLELEKLEKTKPSQESFEPDYLRQINQAKLTLGDYKLKSAEDYIVPDNQRMSVQKKRRHMFLLEEFNYQTKMKFNNELVELSTRKKNLIQKIIQYYGKIQQINGQLGVSEPLPIPVIDQKLENPDSFFEITEEQIQ